MHNETNESAVSEIIGVILVVALTVIMAAIIAAYAFGMTEGTPRSYIVAVTVDQPDASHMYVTYHGGPDHSSLISMTIRWPSGVSETVTPIIGKVYTNINTGATPERDKIVVIGHFLNNHDQVLLETMV